MISSMTGFATRKGQAQGHAWVWEIRSVNGKGLDLRLRVPDWIEGLEPALRSDLGKALQRGSVSLSLKVAAEGGAEGLRVNIATLQAVLRGLSEVEAAARGTGLTLAPPTAAEVLAQRGVLEQGAGLEDTAPLRAALLADLPGLLADFHTMRRSEGAALDRLIRVQLDRIEALTAEAATEAEARRTAAPLALRENLARLLAASEGLDETRIAQELALLAVKQDVTEELDRLGAHVAAARALLDETAPVGRRLDFLVQEFMREANTLCSKAQSMALTRVGLDLKTVIDQMREQIQNVE
ncbi:YicC family protein [Cereibacter sphaeroides]|uniref:YicC/YloC family endoribonuclease n=1 Tax=Cereibacter sphaeroides TaxID=1063 RepID=UPI001F47D693|nr:YicC/YloC family endoribonuclease [Cereibacter sphaeroides]MCE6952856.1 YicC family protein [Cereibacter sphaeroides]